MAILTPYIAENYSKNVEKEQPTEKQKECQKGI